MIKRWIEQGAEWPEGVDQATIQDRYDWWSLKPLVRPEVPLIKANPQETYVDHKRDNASASTSPIDSFVLAKLYEQGLKQSPEADRQTLIRRVSFDLIGLPPSPDDVDAFVADQSPNAYDVLVDRLLDSPHYGERWARHWLDVVHYGDTHGYDKDKPRPNAWPYRDYVIRALNEDRDYVVRSFNSDKPYAMFVEEQIAGDMVAPGTEDGITATGFIAAGPWDFIGHAEVLESKTDGMIARLLDRDDMVSNACNTFLSLTVQCARCHHHKFDPVTQEDYYRLQANFAALDRADRSYDVDPAVHKLRSDLLARQTAAKGIQSQLEVRITELGGEPLTKVDALIAAALKPGVHPFAAQFGYHSSIEAVSDRVKWVQIDLGKSQALSSIQVAGCYDDFNQIGAGFGFPVRFKIELSDDESFQRDVRLVVDHTKEDFANPGIALLTFPAEQASGRFCRVTATKLATRQNDFIFALAELRILNVSGDNLAQGSLVSALDTIEAAPRWGKLNLIDGYYRGVTTSTEMSLADLQRQRDELLERVVDPETRMLSAANTKTLAELVDAIAGLPTPQKVYAGMVYSGSGPFSGTGATGGKPRLIQVLSRGDVRNPGKIVNPGIVPLGQNESGEFSLLAEHAEGERRFAFARWISANENPLTWRSIVNRVWLYHFGRGIVDSPNDFGRMGQLPSHPELLDWLAVEFRDGGQSLKRLHRMIVTSATYRQRSNDTAELSNPQTGEKLSTGIAAVQHDAQSIDGSNVFLWRMNRRKLEAEAVRDAVLLVAGKLNRQLGGPAFEDFVVEKPEHSPHYEYQLHDPDDERVYRRSIYRFLVRSQPQPFMSTLDCADPSMSVDKRNQTVTSLQALAMLNNRLMLTMARDMAARLENQRSSLPNQVEFAVRLTLSRPATTNELTELTAYAKTHGVVNLCRVLMNLNEFVFVD